MKKFLTFALAVILVFGLAACGGGSGTSDAPSVAADAPPEASSAGDATDADGASVITVWSEDIETTLPFNEVFTEYTGGKYVVEITPVKVTEIAAKLQTAIAAGTELPDLILVDYFNRGLIYDMDILEDISQPPYNYDTSTILPAYLPLETTPSGAFTGPEYVSVGVMGYKRNLTEEYFGVSEPEDVEALFSSWDEFKQLGLDAKAKSGGTAYMLPSVGGFFDVLRGYQQGMYVDGTELTLKTYLGPIFDVLIDFTAADIIDVYESGSTEESASYADDDHIFYPMPSWAISEMLKPNDPEGEGRWGLILPMGKGYAMSSGALMVPKGGANKEGAVEYLKFIHTTTEGAEAALELKSSFVCNTALYEPGVNFYTMPDPYFDGQDVAKTYADRALGGLENSILVTKYDKDFMDAVSQALTTINATRGNCTTEELLDQVADDMMVKNPDLTRKD